MEEMDALYTKVQVYFMKKDDDCGRLKFLTSRTTDENSNHIEEICEKVGELLSSCNVPTGDDASPEDPRCVQAFKYLILNTNFESQEHLTEDPLNGHLVDMCPPLSPYLLVEILWSLRYEGIVAKSILHVPLDLAVELIEIAKRCLHLLDFSRGLDFLTLMTLNCYRKLRVIGTKGALTMSPTESLERLMIYCQELMAMYFDPKFTRLNEVADVKRSERHGFILKRMLKLTRDCLECAKQGVTLSDEESTIYKITYGREPNKHINDNFSTQLGMLDQEFVHNLLKKLTDVEVRTYIDWASLEDAGNSTLTLQKSLGIDCYNFIEFIRNHENLMKLDKLVECLQQISSKPEISVATCSELDLEQLRRGLIEGKMECLKELVKRYREWNHEVFAIVRKNHSYLDKEDFLNLLEYLTYIMTKDGQEEHKREVYTTVTRVLLRHDVKNVYETVVSYILKHDARNILESPLTEDTFKRFMSHNKNFKSPMNLRLVLFYLAKNPRKILSILIKMAVGHPDYENVMISPSDLMLLSPIMRIREKYDETLMVAALRQVCTAKEEWNAKKFIHFVRVMLDECILTPDDLVTKVFVPCLAGPAVHPARTILNCLREIVPKCGEATRWKDLVYAIANRMERTRAELGIRKYSIGQAFDLMTRVFDIAYPMLGQSLDEREKAELVDHTEKILGPLDRHHFSKLLLDDSTAKIDIHETLRDYERRCLIALTKVRRPYHASDTPDEDVVLNFQPERFRDDYLRHLVLMSTENEYLKFAVEATVLQYEALGCKDEYAAYENFARSTIEACVLSLEFPQSCAPDSFAALLKSLARFTSTLTSLETFRRYEEIEESLIANFRKLDKHVKQTSFSSLYTSIIVEINNRDKREPIEEKLRELLRLILHFSSECLDNGPMTRDGETSSEARRYKIAHEFVTEVTSIYYADENNSSIWRMYKLLSSSETNH